MDRQTDGQTAGRNCRQQYLSAPMVMKSHRMLHMVTNVAYQLSPTDFLTLKASSISKNSWDPFSKPFQNYHKIGNTELIQIRGFDWHYTTGEPEFNTLEQRLHKVRSDSAENKLDSVQFIIYYNESFV